MKKSVILLASVLGVVNITWCQDTLPSPSAYEDWKLVWNDEFGYDNDDLENEWVSQNGSPGHILSGRWRENLVVEEGVCKLLNKKENRDGKEWTSGNIWTRETFSYGYYECRYKYSAATGTNNSFWLWPRTKIPGDVLYCEMDVNEGHFPNEINTNVHAIINGEKGNDPQSFAIGLKPDYSFILDTQIVTRRIRFTSITSPHFHIREFRIYAPNSMGFPSNVLSETADSDVSGLVNHSRDPGTVITASGVLVKDGLDTKPEYVADGKVQGSSWVTQPEGEKWLEFDWPEAKTIGCIQFINGWKSGDKWNALIGDYKIQYHNGSEWVEIVDFNVKNEYNLAEDFHLYGLLWDPEVIEYYFDGELIRSVPNVTCRSNVNIFLSVAIMDFAGAVTDAIDGTSMVVDFVRFYRPEVKAVSSDVEVQEGSIVQLSAENSMGYGLSYLWIPPPGITMTNDISSISSFTAPEVDKDTTLIFVLQVSDGYTTSTAEVNVLVKDTPVTTMENSKKEMVVVYPNPANNSLAFKNTGRYQRFTINDMTGNVLMQGSLDADTPINISQLPPGFYIYKLKGKSIITSGKFKKR